MKSCFLWFLPVFAVTLVRIERVMAASNFKREQNIGTVLFEKSDAAKQCWTTEDFIILNSRWMFQELLPKSMVPQVKVLNYENDRYIALLMDYFHICLESVRKLSLGKTKHLMLKALADTMGGYLQVYILPYTKHSYYAGNIKYRNARKLFELHEQLKLFLRSNGAGWLKPSREIRHGKIPSIVITPPRTSVACQGIITYPASSDYSKRELQRFTFSKKKRHPSKHKLHKNSSPAEDSIVIPLPFLDDEVEPNSIALPFKSESLMSLHSERSAFVLVKYYIASVKCIVSKSGSKTGVEAFNQELYSWLQQSVQRHLDDDKWYPGFGGVLRVISTLEESGVGTGPANWRKSGSYQMMPKIGTPSTVEPEEGVSPIYKDEDSGVTLGTTELISIAVVSALLVWLLVGLSLVCYRFLRKHSDECGPIEPQNPPVAVLYKNKEYCEADTCPSRRRGLLERFKEYWKGKFGKCQDRCLDEERCLAAINYSSKDTIEVSNSSRGYQRKRCTKSVSASLSNYRKERPPIKRVYYSSDGSLTTNTESPVKSR
ncbi:uncharacterized protein LOC100879460 isoform X1 [Megachile rotundata]|uniref:uncharacterized protein LOC100879460 isoform X1 n=1 Tax=Megachile rotundata TaxID=143995 RepID=UPI0006153BEA|nr:PREDICTED: uncharacterized protein LOC100879460 isoform X1 [Megachile rotundata]